MLVKSILIVFLSLTVILSLIVSSSSRIIRSDSKVNVCMDSKYHKSEPSPEPGLTGECKWWSKRSCCFSNVTSSSSTFSSSGSSTQTSNSSHLEVNHYKVDLNHCASLVGHQMSGSCRKRFNQLTCLIDCDPNLGPFINHDPLSVTKKRVTNIPLCSNECKEWFGDCYHDYTCAYNWPKELEWSRSRDGANGKLMRCRSGKECRRFHEVYRDHVDFCEAVWDHSFKVVNDGIPCLTINLTFRYENPNDRAVKEYLKYSSDGQLINTAISVPVLITVLLSCIFVNNSFLVDN